MLRQHLCTNTLADAWQSRINIKNTVATEGIETDHLESSQKNLTNTIDTNDLLDLTHSSPREINGDLHKSNSLTPVSNRKRLYWV